MKKVSASFPSTKDNFKIDFLEKTLLVEIMYMNHIVF